MYSREWEGEKYFFQTKRLEKLQTHERTWCIWELKVDHQIWKINCETETSGKLYPFFWWQKASIS